MKKTTKTLIGLSMVFSYVIIFATPIKQTHKTIADNILAINEDKSLVALTTSENNFIIRNNKTKQIITVSDNARNITAATFSPKGKKIVYGTEDNNVVIWDIPSKIIEKTIKNFSYLDNSEYKNNLANPNTSHLSVPPAISYVTSLAYSSDGKIIAAATNDNSIRIWKVESEDYRTPDAYGDYYEDDFFMNGITLKGHQSTIKKLLFDNDSSTLASTDDNNIRVWDSLSGRLKKIIPCNSNIELHFIQKEKLYATGIRNNKKYICTSTQS